METNSDHARCVVTMKSTMCWAQNLRSSRKEIDAGRENAMIDSNENRAEERKRECNMTDIDMKAVTAKLLQRHFETSNVE